MSVEYVQLTECEYQCGLCNVVHIYTASPEWDTHRGYAVTSRRWIYTVVPLPET